MRFLRALSAGLLALAGGMAMGALQATEAQRDQLRAIYTPPRVEFAALAPDGRHVAFAVQVDRGYELRVFDTDNPGGGVVARPDAKLTRQVLFLGWAAADRVVVVTDTQVSLVDARTGRSRRLVAAAALRQAVKAGRSPLVTRVIGLTDAPSPQLLMEFSIESDDSTTVHLVRVDLASGKHERAFTEEMPGGGSLIADRQGRARVTFARGTIPQRFTYYAPTSGAKGRDLDEVLTDRNAFEFSVRLENYLGRRTIPLGFGADPNLFYFASNLDRDTYSLRAVNLQTMQCTPPLAEMPGVDLVDLNSPWIEPPLVFDRRDGSLAGVRFGGALPATRWLDAGIANLQADAERDFPGRIITVLEWDEARERTLLLVSAPGDPGRYFVRDHRSGLNTEYLRNVPDLDPELRNAAEPISFPAATGGHITGWVTWPLAPRRDPPALVVWLRDGPLRRGPSGGGRDAQALATLGFAVLELNYAGGAGEGQARRMALRNGYDAVPVAEAAAAVDWLATRHALARDRVAVVGEGFGSYLALRAVQLQPATFRAAVAINTVTDLADFWQTKERDRPGAVALPAPRREVQVESEPDPESVAAATIGAWGEEPSAAPAQGPRDFDREFIRWFLKGGRPLAEVAVTPQADRLVRPVFLLPQEDNPRSPLASTRALRRALQRLQRPPQYLELTATTTRAKLIEQIAAFLASNLDDPDSPPGARR
jgi:pimeloyl-ACP methyl ester carboxylesterase